MKKVYIPLSICFILLISIYILVKNGNITNSHIESLAEHFFQDNHSILNEYVVCQNKICQFDYYSVTIDEYILDAITGVGMIKCSMNKSDYSKHDQSISPYVDEHELLSYHTIDTIEVDDTIYFYYRFILNEDALAKDKCTLYFNRMNLFEKYELEYTNTTSSVLDIDNEFTITYSPFGFVADNDITISSFDKYIEAHRMQNIISDMYCRQDSTKIYKVYILQYPFEM